MTYNDFGGNLLIALVVLHYGFWPIRWLIELGTALRKRPKGSPVWSTIKAVDVPVNFRDHAVYLIPGLLIIGLMTLWFVGGVIHAILS